MAESGNYVSHVRDFDPALPTRLFFAEELFLNCFAGRVRRRLRSSGGKSNSGLIANFVKRTTTRQKLLGNAVVACILIFASASDADEAIDKKTAIAASKKDDSFLFYDLAEEKAKLVVRIDTLRKEIKTLEEEKIPAAERDEGIFSEAKARLERLQRRETELNDQLKEPPLPTGRTTVPDASAIARRVKISDELSKTQAEMDFLKLRAQQVPQTTSQSLKDQLQNKKQQLDTATEALDKVQRAIVRITTPEQSFKTQISEYSSILIGIVIVGFFVIAVLDEKVRQSVFAGQAGIQFLALFSIVIAIILFGITGILGGNELSALIGSISGYILGKVTAEGKGTSSPARAAIPTTPSRLRATPGNTGEIEASCSRVSGFGTPRLPVSANSAELKRQPNPK